MVSTSMTSTPVDSISSRALLTACSQRLSPSPVRAAIDGPLSSTTTTLLCRAFRTSGLPSADASANPTPRHSSNDSSQRHGARRRVRRRRTSAHNTVDDTVRRIARGRSRCNSTISSAVTASRP